MVREKWVFWESWEMTGKSEREHSMAAGPTAWSLEERHNEKLVMPTAHVDC